MQKPKIPNPKQDHNQCFRVRFRDFVLEGNLLLFGPHGFVTYPDEEMEARRIAGRPLRVFLFVSYNCFVGFSNLGLHV